MYYGYILNETVFFFILILYYTIKIPFEILSFLRNSWSFFPNP